MIDGVMAIAWCVIFPVAFVTLWLAGIRLDTMFKPPTAALRALQRIALISVMASCVAYWLGIPAGPTGVWIAPLLASIVANTGYALLHKRADRAPAQS